MAFRGRGRGRGGRGFGGGGGYAKQEPFELFPVIGEIATAEYSDAKLQLIRWSGELQRHWKSFPYFYEDRKLCPEKGQAEKTDIERYSDRNLQKPKLKLELSDCIKLDHDHVPAELTEGGKRKRRAKRIKWNPDLDLRMHKSVLADDVLPDGAALSYVIHGEKKFNGFKKDGAIFWTHCSDLVSPSQFENHAGFASRRKPVHECIYISNGVSLHQLSLELSKIRKPNSGENDDLCSICEEEGDLLCCENCPRAFHTVCVGLSCFPQGTWYCKYCKNMFEKEKYAERNANAIAAGRVPGVDPLADITQRCIRIVATFEADVGECAICRELDFSKSVFDSRAVIICDQVLNMEELYSSHDIHDVLRRWAGCFLEVIT
ncbi:hypothetical protein CASFOL_020814 [Castilleja foliolosa]|uniref:PHD-type domain-containing protein n=1 Tax=Castilleja foliolosa TaxID=1961234 RepID=A0ABD3D2R7_9LAMI